MDISAIFSVLLVLGSFGLIAASAYKKKRLEAEILKFRNDSFRKDVAQTTKELESATLNKKEAYEKAKNNLYELINKRNPPTE